MGWEGVYSVSDLGRIRRDAGGRGAVAGRIITAKRNKKGYQYADLSRDDRKIRRLVHQLVAEAFLPARPSAEHHPNHIDADKTNNSVANLEWLTVPQNNAHARSLGLVPALSGEENGRAKLTAEQVAEIRALKGKVGQRRIAARFRVARTTVQWIHNGRNWRNDPEAPRG